MKFTEQERDFLKQEFADLCHAAINSMITAGSFVRSIDRIEAIVSERITPEQDTIKPYHEHGNSVASDRTESGESGQKIESPFIGEITISDLRKLFAHRASRISEDINQGANQLMTLTDFRLALADMRWRIYNDGLSEPGESGQSAEDVLDQHYKGYLKRIAFPEQVLAAMTTYASQVCADKESDLQDMTAMRESAMRTVKNLADRIEPLQNEIDRLNESMTVMLRKNAELEKEVVEYKKSLIKLKSDLKSR